MTLIASDEVTIEGSWLEKELSRLRNGDDVFSEDFYLNIIFCCRSSAVVHQRPQLDQAALKLLEEMGTQHHEFVGVRTWPAGPYFILDGRLYEAWKLFPDGAEAFYFSIVPDPNDPNL